MANEKRLIDANEVKHIFVVLSEQYYGSFTGEAFAKALKVLENATTIDAVEVVHGEWTIIEDDYSFLTTLRCSVCGEEYCFEEYDEDLPPHYRYCPNCGAKMDGDGDG